MAVHVGRLFSEARLNAGLTQEELALRCGVAQSRIAAFEKERNSPTMRFLERIALGLNCRIKVELVDATAAPHRHTPVG